MDQALYIIDTLYSRLDFHEDPTLYKEEIEAIVKVTEETGEFHYCDLHLFNDRDSYFEYENGSRIYLHI